MGAVITGPDAGAVGSGPANAGYITRSSAVAEEEDERLSTHNVPEDVKADPGESWEQQRIRLRTWAEQVKQEEKARHGNRAGQPRTHYRTVLSYEREIPTAQAQADAQEFLEEAFPDAKAFSVVHQDTDHTHVHIWMSARKVDGKKVHIGKGDIQEINRAWDEIYERRKYGERLVYSDSLTKKMGEAQEFKRKYAQLKDQGASEAELERWAEENRPERATPPGPEVYRERDLRHGVEAVAQRFEAESIEDRLYEDRSSVIEQVEKNLEERHGTSHDRGSEGAEREANEDRQAPGRGERAASEQGRGENQGSARGRASREPGRDRGRSEGGQARGEQGQDGAEKGSIGGYERQGEPEQREESGREPKSPSDGDGDSRGAGGRSGDAGSSEMGDRTRVGGGGGSGSSSSGLGGSEDDVSGPEHGGWEQRAHFRAFDLLMEGEKAEAARVYNDNPDRQEDIRTMLDEEQWAELRDGLRKASRQDSGTDEEYKSLNAKQKSAVDEIQDAEFFKGNDASKAQRQVQSAKEAMSALSKAEREELGGAIPSEAETVFQSVKSGVEQSTTDQGRDQGEDQSEDQGRDRGRSRGGYDRGMGF